MKEWPFLFRDGELDRVLKLVRAPTARGVVLAGPAGAGKTALAAAVLERAAAAGMPTTRIMTGNTRSQVPFGAVAMLLPELPRLPVAPEPTEWARRLAHAVRRSADGGRLVVLVDDAHLLDEGSATVIQQLAVTNSAFVMATVRTGETVPEPVASLWQDELVERIDLETLADAHLGDLLAAYLGGPVAGPTVSALIGRSKGNMLFLRELVRSALSDQALRREGGVWCLVGELHPSDRLVELVAARLRGIGRAERAVLEMLALGEPLLETELRALAADDADTVGGLLEGGLITATFAGGTVRVTLVHPLYGEVLRDQLSATRRRRITLALAEMVEAGGSSEPDDLLRIATWRKVCGGARPEVMEAAARIALQRFDYDLAEQLARAAVDGGAGHSARLLRAELVAMRGHRAEAETLLAKLWDTASDDLERAQVALVRLDNALLQIDLDKLFEICDEALGMITDPQSRLRIGVQRMWAVLPAGGPAGVLRAAEDVTGPFDPDSELAYGVVQSFAFTRGGRAAEAEDALPPSDEDDESYSTRFLGDVRWATLHDFYLCELLNSLGRLRDSEQVGTHAYRRSGEDGALLGTAISAFALSIALAERGRVGSAVRYAREACALVENLDERYLMGQSLLQLAYSSALARDAGAAAEALARFEALALPPALRWHHVGRAHTLAWTAAAHGEIAAAVDLFEEEVAHSLSCGDLIRAGMALHGLARVGHARGAAERLRSIAVEAEGEFMTLRADHAEALVDRDTGRLDAVSHSFESLGADLLAAEAAADAAVLWRRQGNPTKAAASEARARDLTERCEGAGTPALSSVAARSVLTPAEWGTAVLASEGRSNKEIAAMQGITVRTVESFLRHAYAKLGITGRAELAESLRRMGKDVPSS
jgi:DNA-binding CsgD family transcriptional regulator